MNHIFRNLTFINLPETTYSTLNLLDGKLEGLSTMQRVGETTVTIGYSFLYYKRLIFLFSIDSVTIQSILVVKNVSINYNWGKSMIWWVVGCKLCAYSHWYYFDGSGDLSFFMEKVFFQVNIQQLNDGTSKINGKTIIPITKIVFKINFRVLHCFSGGKTTSPTRPWTPQLGGWDPYWRSSGTENESNSHERISKSTFRGGWQGFGGGLFVYSC